jgi:hypothetical protein
LLGRNPKWSTSPTVSYWNDFGPYFQGIFCSAQRFTMVSRQNDILSKAQPFYNQVTIIIFIQDKRNENAIRIQLPP